MSLGRARLRRHSPRMPVLRIPTSLRALTLGQAEVSVEGRTVREVLGHLEREHPGLTARILDDKGAPRRYINLFLNDEDIRYLQGLATPVSEKDTLTLIPAMAGG